MMKQVRAILQTASVGGKPSSEADYLAHLDLVDAALPVNGGLLQADGTWAQIARDVDSDFAQALPGIARDAGQQYVPVANPGTGTDKAMLMAVLDDVHLQEAVAVNLVELALSGRFDSPWDSVAYDVCFVPPDYVSKHEDFLHLLAYRLHRAGLRFEPIQAGWMPGYTDRLPDLSVMGQVADTFDHYLYNWPDSVGPFWWAQDRTVEALEHIPARRTCLGIATFCRYWPVTGQATVQEIAHDQALQLVRDNNSFVQWIECTSDGLIREKYADVGRGHIWLTDGDTMRVRLGLADRYGLAGIMIYTPGMGDESMWQVVAEWKQSTRVGTVAISVGGSL